MTAQICRRLGIEDPARYVGRHYTAIPDRVPDFGSRIERSLAGETFSAVVPVHGRTLSLHHSPIQDEQAVVTDAVVVAFDITEERALEAQVQQAQRMEAVGNLAAGVSHDFNNLLTVVLANLDVARFQEGDDADHALRQAAEAARSAAELSRQLRDIGRANMNVREPVAVAPIVREVLALLDRSLPRNIRTAVDVDAELWVTANPAQLRQVLMNLALNAAEAMPDGGTLRVTASAPAAALAPAAAAPGAAASSAAEVSAPPAELALPQREGGYVVIAVADDGSGMDGETLAWMWDPFFSTKGKDGTGLGTAVAWGIVRSTGAAWRWIPSPTTARRCASICRRRRSRRWLCPRRSPKRGWRRSGRWRRRWCWWSMICCRCAWRPAASWKRRATGCARRRTGRRRWR